MTEIGYLNKLIEDVENNRCWIVYKHKHSMDKHIFLHLLKELKKMCIEKIKLEVKEFEMKEQFEQSEKVFEKVSDKKLLKR